MKKKEDLRVIKTKKSLYDGLLSIMENKAFEDIKVSEICNVSLVNRSTFYDHFNDKYELLSSLLNDLENDLADKLEENHNFTSAKDYYMKIVELLFNHISNNLDIYSSIIKNNNNSISSDIFRTTILKDVENKLKENNSYDEDIPIEIISNFYVSASINVCILYVIEPNKYTKDDILNYLDKLLPNNIYK